MLLCDINYHAAPRKALRSAVKKEMIPRNPADSVDKLKKNHCIMACFKISCLH